MFTSACIRAFFPTLIHQPRVHHIVEVEESNQRKFETDEKQPRGLHQFLDQGLVPDQGVVVQESPDEKSKRNADQRLDEHKEVVDPCHLGVENTKSN